MKLYFYFISFFLLVVGITLSYYIGYWQMYKQNIKLRLDPLEENSLADKVDYDILAIGSSSIKRWPLNDIKFIEKRLYNAGIEGQTSEQVLLRFERILLKHSPRYLIIQVGVNDIKSIGLIDNQSLIESSFKNNIIKIFTICHENNIKPIYITNFPTGVQSIPRSFIWNKFLDSLILKTNLETIKYCRENNIVVIDAYRYLVRSNSMKRKPEYTSDFFHLNTNGYYLLNQKLEIELHKIIN